MHDLTIMLDLAYHLHPYHPQDVEDSQNLYPTHQPCQLAVIELVEVAPPTPRPLSNPSSYFSSSAGSEDSDEDDDDDEVLSESQMDDPEYAAIEDVESYCSSDGDHATKPIPRTDSFQRCMKRILLWRERSTTTDHCGMSPSLI